MGFNLPLFPIPEQVLLPLPSILARGHFDFSAKGAVKMGQVVEAAFEGNFNNRTSGLPQEQHGLPEALLEDIVEDGLSGVRFKSAAEIVFLQASQAGKFIERQRLIEVAVEMAAETFDPRGGFFPGRFVALFRHGLFLLRAITTTGFDQEEREHVLETLAEPFAPLCEL
jgi:hypothetical protein